MRTRLGAWLLLLGAFVLILALAGCGCSESCPQPPQPWQSWSWQQEQTEVARCTHYLPDDCFTVYGSIPADHREDWNRRCDSWQASGLGCDPMRFSSARESWCLRNAVDCCIHDPAAARSIEYYGGSWTCVNAFYAAARSWNWQQEQAEVAHCSNYLPAECLIYPDLAHYDDWRLRCSTGRNIPVECDLVTFPDRRERWCRANVADCCNHDPAEARSVETRGAPNFCGNTQAAAVAAATPTLVPVEAENAPVDLVPPGGKPDASAGVLVLPKPEVVPEPPPACLAPPILFDPPDGKNFAARNTIFRWKPGYDLKPGEVYDILVSTDGGKTFKSIGTTADTILPIDFLKWDFAGVTTNFSWTVRVRDASGKYVTCEGKWFSMILGDIPPAGNPAQVGPPPPVCVPSYNVKCP